MKMSPAEFDKWFIDKVMGALKPLSGKYIDAMLREADREKETLEKMSN